MTDPNDTNMNPSNNNSSAQPGKHSLEELTGLRLPALAIDNRPPRPRDQQKPLIIHLNEPHRDPHSRLTNLPSSMHPHTSASFTYSPDNLPPPSNGLDYSPWNGKGPEDAMLGHEPQIGHASEPRPAFGKRPGTWAEWDGAGSKARGKVVEKGMEALRWLVGAVEQRREESQQGKGETQETHEGKAEEQPQQAVKVEKKEIEVIDLVSDEEDVIDLTGED